MEGPPLEADGDACGIARRMTKSKQEAPHFYVSTEVRLDGCTRYRRRDRAASPRESRRPSRLSAPALVSLATQPRINSVWTDDGLLEADEINVAVAIALDGGLIAPALLGADRMTFARPRRRSAISSHAPRADASSPPS